jgi:hypothetical protein
MPLVGDYVLGFNIEGRPPIAPSDLPSTNYYSITLDYLRHGNPSVHGRIFTSQDDAAPRVAINETMARQFSRTKIRSANGSISPTAPIPARSSASSVHQTIRRGQHERPVEPSQVPFTG